MQRAKKIGFAGLPGVVLDGRDIRQLDSYFADGSALQTPALSGLGGPGAACTTCAPGSTTNEKLAAKVLREIGATELAALSVDGKQSSVLDEVGTVTAALTHLLKFRTDRVAILSGMTSEMFSKSVERLKTRFHGVKPEQRFESALTLCFLTGKLDCLAGRRTINADAFTKVRRDLIEALKTNKDPAYREAIEGMLAKLNDGDKKPDQKAVEVSEHRFRQALKGLSAVTAPGYVTAPTAASASAQAVNAAYRERDTGAPDRSPAALTEVSLATLPFLWDYFVGYAQTCTPEWPEKFRPWGAIGLAGAIKRGKDEAAGRLDLYAKRRQELNPAELLASWIIRYYANRILTYERAGLSDEEWSFFSGVPETSTTGGTLYPPPTKLGVQMGEPSIRQPTRWMGGDATKVFSGQNEKNTGLTTMVNILGVKTFRGVTSSEFQRQCMIAYFSMFNLTRDQLQGLLNSTAGSFPRIVGAAMNIARLDALGRTGQTGFYDSMGAWQPNPAGQQQVPPGTPEFADWRAEFREMEAVRSDAITFVYNTYQAVYKKPPTAHAIGWYGRMRFGLGGLLAPNDREEYRAAIAGAKQFTPDVVKTSDDIRLAGGDPPPNTLKERVNYFLLIGSYVFKGLSWVMDIMSTGVQYAVDTLCVLFKWMFGDTAGGLVCAVFSALAKLLLASVKTSMAVSAALTKALIEFIGHVIRGEWKKAFVSLFLGINTAIFFSMGGWVAEFLGRDRMPLLKSDEEAARQKARAMGQNPDDVVFPSLERMAEKLTREEPFFIFAVLTPVLSLIITTVSTAGTATAAVTLRHAGELILALCPVMGIILAPSVTKWIQTSNDPFAAQYKALSQDKVAEAITLICKIIATTVMGIIKISKAISMLRERWALYVQKKGGTGAAIRDTFKFFFKRLGDDLFLVFATIIPAAKSGFDKNDPCMIIMTDTLKKILSKLPSLIIAFASEELGLEGKELEDFKALLLEGVADLQEARRLIGELQKLLGPESPPIGEAAEAAAAAAKKKKDDRSKLLLPLLYVVGGLVLGNVLFGGSDGDQ